VGQNKLKEERRSWVLNPMMMMRMRRVREKVLVKERI
jgi:hypothetical protein